MERLDFPTYCIGHPSWWRHQIENIFRVTGPLCGEFTGHRWIPLTKANDVELWCFIWSAIERLSKQSWSWWFETPSHSLWRHCNRCSVRVDYHFVLWLSYGHSWSESKKNRKIESMVEQEQWKWYRYNTMMSVNVWIIVITYGCFVLHLFWSLLVYGKV